MAAPEGNKNAKGNAGGQKGRSGRKSAHKEQVDAKFWLDMFLKPVSQQEMEKKLRSGRVSPKDVMLAKAIAGNDKVLVTMYRKLVPDKVDIQANLQQKQIHTLEGNMRDLLEVGQKIARETFSTGRNKGVNRAALESMAREAEKATKKRTKPLAKKKVAVKKKKAVRKKK